MVVMDNLSLALAVLIIFSFQFTFGYEYVGDQIVYFTNPEVNGFQLEQPKFQPMNRGHLQHQMQPILHAGTGQPQPQVPLQKARDGDNIFIEELLEALNGESQPDVDTLSNQFRAAAPGNQYTSYPPYPHPPTYGLPPRPPTYSSPPAYHEPALVPVAPAEIPKNKVSFLKPDLSSLILKPVTKVSNKANSLVSLVFSLLTGNAPAGLNGIKDVFINAILKPLLTAKHGIKSLISKLSIPVISLLLINLEVLFTVWWLWEECPQPTPAPPLPSYSAPSYNYSNAYNSYR